MNVQTKRADYYDTNERSNETIFYGSINTALLLTSSFTMTVALRAATVEMRKLTLVFLAATAALGLAFLACKGLEYREDLKQHLFPGPEFPLSPPATQMFWGFYWVMTGIHAAHLSAGTAVVLAVFVLFKRSIIPVQGSTMEGVAIYWHSSTRCGLCFFRCFIWRVGHERRRSRAGSLLVAMAGPRSAMACAARAVRSECRLGLFAPRHWQPRGQPSDRGDHDRGVGHFSDGPEKRNALIRVVAAAGLLWLILMFSLTFSDYLSRYY